MSKSTVAIVGSGVVGSIMAFLLTKKGIDVAVFEKGPDYPYPHKKQFKERTKFLYDNPGYEPPSDIQNLTSSGDYPRNPNHERSLRIGGSSTRWEAIALRMPPNDFNTKSQYGFGDDWPITYDILEPYYCKAEAMLGVSGTDDDNPFAPPRSRPFPLKPFELSYDDLLLAERLKKKGILLHTTPQARTRKRYGKRQGCVNYGTCRVCPIGARYSPNFHLQGAVETGLCTIHKNTSVRRIITDSSGRARSLLIRPENSTIEQEHAAKIIIVAAGAIESPRLLFLSKNETHPNGLGNNGGLLGKNFLFHHVWQAFITYKDYLFPGRFGGRTAESHQFMNPSRRGVHGGIKVTFPSRSGMYIGNILEKAGTGKDIINSMKQSRHQRTISFHAETVATPKKYVTLSEKLDRYGDPFAHVHYESDEFDMESYKFAQGIFDSFVSASEGVKTVFPALNHYHSGAHHMGGVRMGNSIGDSVVDQYGKVHETSNLFAVGGGNFVTSGRVNPTLTIAALAIRSAEYIIDQML